MSTTIPAQTSAQEPGGSPSGFEGDRQADSLGASARAYVERERSMTVMAAQWDAVLRAVTGRPAAGGPAPRVTAPLPA